MDMLSLFRRRSGASDGAPAEPIDPVQTARTRARRRLVGAAVLVAAGIVGFPLLFETEPRPIPIDVPIEIPQREGAAPLQMPGARPEPAAPGGKGGGATAATGRPARDAQADAAAKPDSVITETVAEAGREIPPPPLPEAAETDARAGVKAQPRVAAADAAAARAASAADAAKPPRPKPAPAAASAARPAVPTRGSADAARAQALLEGRPVATARAEAPPAPAAPASPAAGSSRFFVQIGAFAADQSVTETRSKAEKLGLKTYTQVAETSAGRRTRVRVGPFSSREEAERAAAKLKSASLPAVILSP